MLNLEELVFKVNTKELVDAVGKVKELGTEVANLARPIDKAVAASDKLAKAQQQEATTAAKAAKATTDLAAAETKAGKARGEAAPKIDTVTRSIEKQLTAMKVFRGEAINAADGAIALGTAFTKTQANQLAALKVSGATTEALKTMARSFEEFNKITSANTFDNSVAGIQRLRKEIAEMSKVDDLMKQGIKLTRDEIVNLVRDSERLTQQFKSEGLSAQQLDVALSGLTQEHVLLARQKNDLVARSKESERQAKAEANAQIKAAQDQARAIKYLEDTERRMAAAVDEANRGLDRGATDTLVKYKQALMQAGLAADVAEGKMATLKSQMDLVASRKRADELRYLSRALSVQMGDVAISLASGMNPLLVMIQQGDQIRGVLDQVGAQGDELRKSMNGAAAQIATGMKNTAIAIGTFFVGAVQAAGKSVLDFFVAPVKLAKAAMIDFIYNGNAFEAQMGRLQAATSGFARTAGILGGILGGTLLVALYQLSSAQDDFVRALYQSGASLDMNKEKAQQFAISMESMGVSSTKAMQALTEIAKAGGFTQESLQGIITSAVNMEKYAGVAIEKTVENYKKLQDKPSEALIELAKNTGYLTAEQLKQIKSFEDVGDKVTAATMAMKAFSDIQSQIAANIQANLSPLERAFIDMKAAVVGVWHEFKTWASESELLENVLGGLGLTVKVLALGFKVLKAIMSGATWPELRDSLTKDAESIRDYLDVSKKGVNGLDAATREYNANAVKGYQNQLKLAAELKGKLDPQQMGKDAFVAAKMRGLLASTGGSFATDLNALKMMKDATAKFTKEWQDGQAKVTSGTKDTKKEVDETLKYQLRIQESVRDLVIETGNLGKQETEITKATKLRADLVDDPLWHQQTEQAKINLLAALDILEADEKRFKQQEKHQKLVEEEWKKTIERQKESDKHISDNLAKQSESLQESGKDLEFQYSLLGKSDDEVKSMTREYERQNKLRKAFLDYEKTLADIRNASPADQESLRLQAERQYAEQVRQINSETALQSAQDYERAFKEIQGTITDIIATALFEGGKAGQKKLKDVLKNAFRNFVLDVVINPIVRGGMNAAIGAVTGTGSSSAGGIGAMIGEGFNDYVSNTAIGAMLTSTGGYAAAIGGGSVAAGSQAAMLAAQTSGFGVAGTALTAQAAGGAAGAVGGAYAGVMNALAAIPVWGWIAMAVVALLGSGFGTTPGEQHIGGMYSTRGSELNMDTARAITGGGGWDDGAWARDLTERGTEEMGGALQKIVDGALGEANAVMGALGIGKFTIDAGFAANLNGEGSDKNAFGYFNLYDEAGNLVKEYINRELGEDLEQAIAKFGGDIQEAVSSVVLAGTDFQREGETNVQTIGRLTNALIAVNQVAELLGMNTLDLSLVSGDAASSLVDLFGSIENLKTASQSFYDNFASDAIKAADAQSLLEKTFGQLGLQIPKTRDEYYQLVKGLDLTEESGREAYVTLLGVSDSFLSIEDNAKSATEIIDDAFSALEAAVKREQDMISKRISAIESTRNALSKLFDVLSKATRELYGSVDSTKGALVGQARQFITDSVVAARSGGGLPDADKMSEAIGTVRTGISDTLYATRFEEERDTLMLAGELFELQGYAGEELTNAELQLKELKDQSEQMELMLESYRVQIDLAKNLDVSVLSVADAIRQMEQTLADLLDPTGAKRGISKGSSGSGNYMMGTGNDYGRVDFTTTAPDAGGRDILLSREEIMGGQLAYNVNNRTDYETAQSFLTASSWLGGADAATAAMLAAGATQEQADEAARVAAEYEAWKQTTGGVDRGGSSFLDYIGADNPYAWQNLPSYDVGTNYVPRDMVAKIHEGEAIVPKRYNPDAGGESKIEALEAGLVGMRAELQAIALSSDKTRRLLERVTQDGNSLLVTDTATL